MPPRNVRQCLDRILDSLSKEDFDRFVNELVQRQQDPRVSLNRVEGKRRWEVVEVIIATFTENQAVEVAVELLEDISQINKAEELVKLARSCGYKPTSGSSDAVPGGPSPAAAGGPPPKKHIVDKHRTALIQKLTLIDPILDVLLEEKVINPEMYADIRAEKTSQNKTRKLYDYLEGTGEDGKDIFWSVLRKDQEYLVKNLEKQ